VAACEHPVGTEELMAALRKHLHRPPAPPAPAPVLKLGAVVLRTDPALGPDRSPRHVEGAGAGRFHLSVPDLDATLADLL
jgi:hypothetical protein